MKKVYRMESDINGVGIFIGCGVKKYAVIGPSHFNYSGMWYNTKYYGDYNHSVEPNCIVKTELGIKLLIADRDIEVDEELTVDYREQQDLEQPKKEWIEE